MNSDVNHKLFELQQEKIHFIYIELFKVVYRKEKKRLKNVERGDNTWKPKLSATQNEMYIAHSILNGVLTQIIHMTDFKPLVKGSRQLNPQSELLQLSIL